MADLSKKIKEACFSQNNRFKGILPPQVCPYCMGCPIGTIVTSVVGPPLRQPREVSEEGAAEVEAWLDRIKAGE